MKEVGTLLDASNAILYGESRLPLMNPNPKYAPSAAPPIGSPKPSPKTNNQTQHSANQSLPVFINLTLKGD